MDPLKKDDPSQEDHSTLENVEDEKATGPLSDETCFFEEFEEVFHNILPILVDSSQDTIIQNGSDEPWILKNSEALKALSRFRCILDKYLEFPTLLDPYLERMAGTLGSRARDIVHLLYQHDWNTQKSSLEHFDSNNTDETGEYTLQHWTRREKNLIQSLKRLLSSVYALTKVRGRKQVQRYLSHEVCDVEPVLYLLRCFQTDVRYQNHSEDDSNSISPTWESIFSLFLWLGILSLVPFGLNSIDSTFESFTMSSSPPTHEGAILEQRPTLITSILLTARQYLSDPGPTRETAAACLASLLSRPDLEELELEIFFMFSSHVMESYWKSITDTSPYIQSGEPVKDSIFLVMGVIHTIAIIFKTGSRSTLMDRHLRCVESIWRQAILLAEWASPKGNLLLRKLLVKLFTRVGCAYLPPRSATWRYQRGKRSLLDNIAAVAGHSNIHEEQNGDGIHGPDEIFLVPDPVEDSMAQMVQSLNDPATAVRWSAAKGIGRLSERLPMICVDDVVDAILVLCEDTENDDAWHGSCLALAELARRGLLLPHRLTEVVPIVIFAMSYDLRRGQRSIGSHIRDAACYTCWAFARAYAPSILSQYVPELGKIIVLTSLFDREINCRRAASACFQECVGRQGSDNFKNGIEILTIADYFSIGNRVDAFTIISIQVAQFDEYRYAIIEHLCDNKLFHWDVDIRVLSSKALQSLTRLDGPFFQNSVLSRLIPKCTNPNNYFVRHGAILGVAEITLALGKISTANRFSEAIAEIVPNVEKARLYRGRGGDLMRSAISRLIECMSISNIELTIKQQVRLLDSVDANLYHPSEDVQRSSAAALFPLLRSYFPVGLSGPSDRLKARVVTKYTDILRKDDNAAATRGFALAIGQLPSKLIAPNENTLELVVDVLCLAAHPKARVGDEADAETRTNALKSLSSICKTVGIGRRQNQTEYPTVGLRSHQVRKIFNSFLLGMTDYNTDRRGDVGSWARIAAMYGVVTLTVLATRASVSSSSSNSSYSVNDDDIYITESICLDVLGSILKQLSEKLDSVRSHAGSCLQQLLLNPDHSLLLIPYREQLIEAFSLGHVQAINWGQSSITFPLLLKAIRIEPYFYPILSGLVISMGGITESVTKSASSAVLDYCRFLKFSQNFSQLNVIGNGWSLQRNTIFIIFDIMSHSSTFTI